MTSDTPLDQLWPKRGPCAFCGGPDARHRTFDAITGRFMAGDSIAALADDYEISRLAVELAIREGVRGERRTDIRLREGAIQVTADDEGALFTVRGKDHTLEPHECLDLAQALMGAFWGQPPPSMQENA